jgi:hypothetical protein
MDRLPIVVIAHVLGFGPRDLGRLHAVARALLGRAVLVQDGELFESVFQALCKTRWRSVSDATFDACRGSGGSGAFRQSKSSWRCLYRLLHTWLPREGFYSLLEVNPWGMMLRLRFLDGAFVGELLCPLEEAQIDTLRQASGAEAFRYEPVFRIEFSRRDGSVERVRIVGGGTGTSLAAAAAGVEEEGAGAGESSKRERGNILVAFDGHDGNIRYPTAFGSQFPNVVASARAIRIHDPSPVPGEPFPDSSTALTRSLRGLVAGISALVHSNSDSDTAEDHLTPTINLSRALEDPESPHSHSDIFRALWEHGHARGRAQLTLDWIDGPTRMSSFSYREGMPILRPGLYSGVYHEMYGKFKREVVLIEYRQYALPLGDRERENEWQRIGLEIFNQENKRRDGQCDATGAFDAVKGTVNAIFHDREDSVVFVVGRKVTGDMHVPMRQLTFGAVVHPVLSLLAQDGAAAPRIDEVRDRGGAQRMHRVIRSWSGWGTLAYPRFDSPSWARGMLVQVGAERADHAGGSSHSQVGLGAGQEDLFGFVWSRGGDSGAMDNTSIFRRLPSQDEFPWFAERSLPVLS